MLLSFYNSIKADKCIEHPVLGEITCSGYFEAYNKCQELMHASQTMSLQCKNFHDISLNCFRADSNEQFMQWLQNKINERRDLNKFLKENDSILPQLQKRNMFYDVFITNSESLEELSMYNSKNFIEQYYAQQGKQNMEFFRKEENTKK